MCISSKIRVFLWLKKQGVKMTVLNCLLLLLTNSCTVQFRWSFVEDKYYHKCAVVRDLYYMAITFFTCILLLVLASKGLKGMHAPAWAELVFVNLFKNHSLLSVSESYLFRVWRWIYITESAVHTHGRTSSRIGRQ